MKNSIYYDLKVGILARWKLLIPIILISLCGCISLIYSHRYTLDLTFGDLLVSMEKGMEVYKIEGVASRFELPSLWIAFHFYISFLIGYYPFKDFDKLGNQILINESSRIKWWISKVIWNISVILLSYFIMYVVIFVVSTIFGRGGIFPQDVNIQAITMDWVDNISKKQFVFVVVLLPILISVALGLFQMMLALLIDCFYAQICILVLFAISGYACNNWLPGNYLMVMRYKELIGGQGVDSAFGWLLGTILVIVSVIGGLILSKRKDII